MLGYRLFRHAVLMLIDNLGPAFRISILPAVLFFALTYLMMAQFFSSGDAVAAISEQAGLFAVTILCLAVAGFVVFCWVATAWHRYVLLEEQPGAALPRWNGDAIRRYVGASFRVFGITFLVALPLALGLSVLSGREFSSDDGTWLSFAFNFAISYLSLRWSLVLPAAALESHITVFESWRRSRDFAGAIFVANLLVNLLVSVPALVAGSMLNTLFASYSYFAVASWLQLMLSISLLTALYGHIVEGRSLR